MAMMFGRFEIQSEISKSETASIYKALDKETSQVVALKTQNLAPLGNRAAAFVETLIAEGERALPLASQNIVPLYGAGEIEGQFCAAMEYVQGNSIANMLARKEGFSIWDLLDITRQVCAAMEHAATREVVHCSLEPDKILVQWDGLVKVLGYGISNMSLIEAESGNGLGRLMPYCSPEQIRGEPMDQRSNQCTLGAILYEMVTGRKAYDADDPVVLVGQVENEMPPEPIQINTKIQPSVSALIMRALAKDPAERYPTIRELLADLENCKDGGKKAAPEVSKPASQLKFDTAMRRTIAKKFVTADPGPDSAPPPPPKPAARERAAAAAKAAAAAMGRTSPDAPNSASDKPSANSGAGMIEVQDAPGKGAGANYTSRAPVQSASTLTEPPKHSPGITVDPAMAAPAQVRPAASFSDIEELPPLKLPFTAPPPPMPEVEESAQRAYPQAKQADKKKVQPREVADRAIREIATVPPRLVLFSILGAVAVILVVAVALYLHVHTEDDGSVATPSAVKSSGKSASAEQASTASAEPASPVALDEHPAEPVRAAQKRHPKNEAQAAPAPLVAVVAGDALIDSIPQAAQFQVDGRSDPTWVTPFIVAGLSPGKHIVSASKSGYTTEIRSVDVVAGSKASLVFRMTPMNALVVVTSAPAGAEITVDGRPTGRITPAQFAMEKGSHTILLRKQGFLDETTTVDLGAGQNFQYAPVLKGLGDADAIHTVGKFKKIFGGGGGEGNAGMGSVSIHTQPKGAQVVINQRIMDKMSPVDVMMGPGNYVVDITLTGFKPVHKVLTVEKGGKVAIDEILERQ